MTDLTALIDLPSPSTDDLVYVVDDPASGKNPRKCSIANLVDARTKTLTNTTIDAEGTGNSITNIVNANIKSSAGIATSKIANFDTQVQEILSLGVLLDEDIIRNSLKRFNGHINLSLRYLLTINSLSD